MKKIVNIVFFILLSDTGALATKAQPGSNIFAMNGQLQDQNSRGFSMSKYRGKTLLVVVGYSSCPKICPMVTGKLKALDQWFGTHKVPPEKLQFLFLTVDPQDTPADLLSFAGKHHLDLQRWTLAQMPPEEKSQLVAALDLSFDKTKSQDHLRHSFSLVVVNSLGVIAKTYPSSLDLDLEKVATEIRSIVP